MIDFKNTGSGVKTQFGIKEQLEYSNMLIQ